MTSDRDAGGSFQTRAAGQRSGAPAATSAQAAPSGPWTPAGRGAGWRGGLPGSRFLRPSGPPSLPFPSCWRLTGD